MSKSSAAYPFVTRREIQARLESEPAFVAECASVLQGRTEQRGAGAAPVGKPWGWMSSERVVAGRLTAKSKIGMLSADEEAKLAKLVSRYSRQLADHFRALAIEATPGLSVVAVKFGVHPGGSAPFDTSQGPRNPQERAENYPSAGARQPNELEHDIEAELEAASEVVNAGPEVVDDERVNDGGTDAEPFHDDDLPRRVMECIERLPGERTDAIAKALDTTTAMIAPTLRVLLQGRKLKKQGFGRGTRYFVR